MVCYLFPCLALVILFHPTILNLQRRNQSNSLLIHKNLGRGLGLTVGSIITSAYGIRMAYLVFGVLAGATSLFYLVSYHLFLKNVEQSRTLSSDQSIFLNFKVIFFFQSRRKINCLFLLRYIEPKDTTTSVENKGNIDADRTVDNKTLP